MLAACLEVPTDETGWGVWAFHAKQQIDVIRQAIMDRYGVSLKAYVLYPWTPTDSWLQNVFMAHSDFNSVLGLQGHSLQSLDWKNRDEVASWIDLAYKEMFDASSMLEI